MDTASRQQLKGQAHHLKPVVIIGAKGLTPAVINEVDLALVAHELIKIKIHGAEKEDKKQMVADICQQLKAVEVQIIGNIAVIYRQNPKK